MTHLLLAAFILLLPWLRSERLCVFPGDLRGHAAAALALLLAGLVPWRAGREEDGPQPSRGPGIWPAALPPLAYLAWNALSLCWSADRFATRTRLLELAPWTLLALVTAILARRPAARARLAGCVALAGVLSGMGGIGMWLRGRGLHPSGRLQYPFDHPAALGGSLVLPCVLLAGAGVAWLARGQRRRSLAAGLLLVPVLAGLCLARTRTCLLGAGAGLWLAFFLCLRSTARRALLAAAMLAAAAGCWYALHAFSGPGGRDRLYTGTFGIRVLCARTALRMARARPCAGHGAGAFCKASAPYTPARDYLHARRGDIVLTAHGEPAQVLAELGAIGLLLWLGLHLAVMWPLLRSRPPRAEQARAGEEDIVLVDHLLAAGLVGMFVDACGSMSLRYAELPPFYAIGLGLALGAGLQAGSGKARAPTKEQHARQWPRGAWALPALIAGIAWTWRILLPGLAAERAHARVCRESPGPREAIALLRRARRDSVSLRNWYYASYDLARRLEADGRVDESLRVRREILAHFPAGPVNRQRLVSLLCRAGDLRAALLRVLEGLRLNPFDRRMDEWLDEVLRRSLRAGEREAVHAWLRGARLADADRAFVEARLRWLAGERRRAVACLRALEPSRVRVGRAAYRLALWHTLLGEREPALALLEPLVRAHPADPRALALAARLLAPPLGGARELRRAWELLDRALRLGPAVPEVVSAAVDMYVAGGDYARADEVSGRGLSLNDRDPRLWRARILCLRRLGRAPEALKLLARARRMFPRETVGWRRPASDAPTTPAPAVPPPRPGPDRK